MTHKKTSLNVCLKRLKYPKTCLRENTTIKKTRKKRKTFLFAEFSSRVHFTDRLMLNENHSTVVVYFSPLTGLNAFQPFLLSSLSFRFRRRRFFERLQSLT